MTVLTTMACSVTSAGISRPAFTDLYETLQSIFQGIYGSDAYIDPDSQDGQLLAAIAKAIDDVNDTAVSVYNSFSPVTASGAALSNNVKINGIARQIATKGTVTMRLVGVVGTVIPVGSIVADSNGNRWVLPLSTIPAAGYIDVTATAEASGFIQAPIGTITQIQMPTRGWQSAVNMTAAVAGAPVELDPALRQRQAVSVALPSLSVLEGMAAAVRAVVGVTAVKPYENASAGTDVNGVPAHGVSLVVQGGSAAAIGLAIMRHKTPGSPTYGNQTVTVTDVNGNSFAIKYTIPTPVAVAVEVNIKAQPGYQSTYGDLIREAVRSYIAGLGSGKKVDLGRIYMHAQMLSEPLATDTFEVESIRMSANGGALAAADVPIAYDQIADAPTLASVTLLVS